MQLHIFPSESDAEVQTVSDLRERGDNEHRQSGSFIHEDGSTGQMNDVWFATDPVDTDHLDDVDVPEDIKKLPNIRGWNSVRSMHQVMATDNAA